MARQTLGSLPDRELLRLFVTQRDQNAFATLLERHGPLVLRVSQRVLANRHDAEDVFQAAFLVLARKAGSTRWQDSIANWLYGVTYHLALKVKRETARRSARESRV